MLSGRAGSAVRAPVDRLYRFAPPVGTPYGLEVRTVEDFHAEHDPWPYDVGRPGRATFHYLIHVRRGRLRHDVDSVTHDIGPGRWLWVRPGHTQGWHPPGDAAGPFILFEPDVLSPDAARLLSTVLAHDAPAVLTPHADDAEALEQTAHQLLAEHRAMGRRPLAAHHALRRSLLESILLRLTAAPEVEGARPPTGGRVDLHARFADAVELRFRETRQAAEYARLLGCSVRTLDRATRAAVGKAPREIIDDRRLLEARRLLVLAGWDARAVASHLGFANAANFGRSFRARTGLSPAAFATEHRP
jgi:AraC-like DNA-binding protein